MFQQHPLILTACILVFVIAVQLVLRARRTRPAAKPADPWGRPEITHGYSLGETLERREAFKRGLDLDEYRRVRDEEQIADAARQLGITPEEVVAQGLQHLPRIVLSWEVLARRRSAEQGRVVTRDEIAAEFAENIESVRGRTYTEEENACIEAQMSPFELEEYAETGTLAEEPWKLEHLKWCEDCRTAADRARADFAQPPGPDCYTPEELAAVAETGQLSKARSSHMDSCRRCFLHFGRCRSKHFAAPPGPDCLNPDELHQLHSTGAIAPIRSEHMLVCSRCDARYDREIERYLDTILPIPWSRLP